MSDHNDFVIQRLVVTVVTKCARCGEPLTHESVNVLGHKDDLWFVMIVCPSCRGHTLVAAVIQTLKAEACEGDSSAQEVRQSLSESVSERDVVAMREFLDSFDGDFAALFGKDGAT